MAKTVREVQQTVRPELKDAYFAAIYYPVMAAEAHARKMLHAQVARQLANGSTTKGMFDVQPDIYAAVAKSQSAYQEIRAMTEYYNEVMAGGKWNRSMNMRPRDLPVHGAPLLPTLLTDAEVQEWLKRLPPARRTPSTPTAHWPATPATMTAPPKGRSPWRCSATA